MREELTKLAEDIRKVQEAEALLASVSTTKMSSEIDKLINYALSNGIIKGVSDIIDLSADNPGIKNTLADGYDAFIESKMDKEKEKRRRAEEAYENRYAGTYDSWADVPGYGKEWNMRCKPSGVIIRNERNGRC